MEQGGSEITCSHQKLTGTRKEIPLEPSQECGPSYTLALDLWPPNCANLRDSKPPELVVTHCGSPGKPTHLCFRIQVIHLQMSYLHSSPNHSSPPMHILSTPVFASLSKLLRDGNWALSPLLPQGVATFQLNA